MPQLTIDNKHYDIDQLPDNARAQVASLQFVDSELQRLNACIAVFQTARMGYLNTLMPLLVGLEDKNAATTQPPLKH